MCGIFGLKGNIDQPLALQCLNTLAHRGPDGWGLWSQPGITLGHRRLSILDLSDSGKQPMHDASSRYHITFNGEIYNFLELRTELGAQGFLFRSQSDTEVVLAAFITWGASCLDRFNGMWSLAIWDSQEQALFLSRDRLGKKPLFYTHLPGGRFAFASEMKALFPLLPEVRPNQALVRSTGRIFQYESSSECVIEHIERFPAGHYGWLKSGKLQLKRWWCTLDHLMHSPSRYEEQVEQFHELFLDACRIRMRSDVPIGTALSGGLDSSATLSVMSHLGKQNLSPRASANWQHAFVAAFPGTPLDETTYAAKVTRHIGIPATFIQVDPLKAIDRLNDYFYLFEDLYITSPIPFMLTYQAVKDHGISVTLDGHGADELFGGYNFDYVLALTDAGWNLKQAYEIADTYLAGLPQESAQFAQAPSRSGLIARHHARRWAKKLLRRSPQPTHPDARHAAWQGLGHLNQQLYVSTHQTILPTLLRNYDRYSMANGVEIRMPFLDHRLLSLAFSLPWTAKLRNGYSKAIIRDALARYMPHDVAYRKTKIGFNSPIVDWMKGPLKSFMLDTLHSQSFRSCDLINPEQVAQTIRQVIENPAAKYSEGEQAWQLLSPYLWEQALFHRTGSAT